MVQREQCLAAAVGVAVCLPAPARACELSPPVCQVSDGRFASLVQVSEISGTDIAYFDEFVAAEGRTDAIYVVECTSRQGVKAEIPPTEGYLNETADRARDYLGAVVNSRRAYTLRQVRNGLRKMGIAAELITLPRGHCGCDLPKMPPVGCGDAP